MECFEQAWSSISVRKRAFRAAARRKRLYGRTAKNNGQASRRLPCMYIAYASHSAVNAAESHVYDAQFFRAFSAM